ncbi:MAG: ABC transporter substrate-binding protein [Elusimicrobia bacterium]|nr:ABC transporter substrate-binding protein [Elusimicrobiota bacterium]
MNRRMILLGLLLLWIQGSGWAEVNFWHTNTAPRERETIDRIATEFTKKTGIPVKVTVVPATNVTDITRLMTSIQAGIGPDIYRLDRFSIGERAAMDMLQALNEYAQKDKWNYSKDFYPFIVEECTWRGHLYALPMDTDTRALLYRKDLFRQVGLNPEKPPKTIKELDAAAEKLTQRNSSGNLDRIGFIPWLRQGFAYTWGWAFGGQFTKEGKLNLTDPAIVESLEWMRSYAQKYDPRNIANFVSGFGLEANDPFVTGKVAMIVDGSWSVGALEVYAKDLDYGIAPLPTSDGKKIMTWSGGWGLVIPRGAKHPEEAWKFMRFVSGPEGQRMYSLGTDNLPSRPDVKPETFVKDPRRKAFMQLLKYSRIRPVLPVGALLWDELKNATDQVIYGKEKALQALQKVQDKVTHELERFNK